MYIQGKGISFKKINKITHSLVNARLVWSLESQGLLTEIQCGFRKNRSTLDHPVRFETLIFEMALCRSNMFCFCLFFNLEKAYAIRLRNTAFFQISATSASEGIFPFLLMDFYPTDFLKSE